MYFYTYIHSIWHRHIDVPFLLFTDKFTKNTHSDTQTQMGRLKGQELLWRKADYWATGLVGQDVTAQS